MERIAGHLVPLFCNPEWIIDRAKAIPKDIMKECDTFVGRGISGTIAAFELARHFNKTWVAVRKPEEKRNSINKWEGILGAKYIFVDDFIASGKTFKACYSAIGTDSECLGVYSYFRNDKASRWMPMSEAQQYVTASHLAHVFEAPIQDSGAGSPQPTETMAAYDDGGSAGFVPGRIIDSDRLAQSIRQYQSPNGRRVDTLDTTVPPT